MAGIVKYNIPYLETINVIPICNIDEQISECEIIIDRIDLSSKLNIFLNSVANKSFVYMLCVEDNVTYIGYTSVLKIRLCLHRKHYAFDKVIIHGFDDCDDAYEMEQHLINKYKPELNNVLTVFESKSKNKGCAKSMDYILGWYQCFMTI